MASYRLEITDPQPLVLLVPTYKNVSGVNKKSFPKLEKALKDENNLFFGSFKTYGGTEKDVNGVYSVEDTATIETWYRPDIKSGCRIARANDGAVFDIINEPEDIDQRHQFLKFKVRRVKGNT